MRVCTKISDGKLIEAQSGGNGQPDLDVLVANAISAGYTAQQVEARYCTDQEYKTLLDATVPPPDPRLVLDEEEQAAIKQDAQVQTFLNMTPMALDQWVDNNIGAAATLAALRTATATALKVLGRLAQQGARGRRIR